MGESSCEPAVSRLSPKIMLPMPGGPVAACAARYLSMQYACAFLPVALQRRLCDSVKQRYSRLATGLCTGYLLYYLLHGQHGSMQADDVIQPGMARDAIDCETGFSNFEELWDEDKKAICCDLYGRACSQFRHYQHVTHVVYHHPQVVHHYTKYSCHAGYSNWYFGWSHHKKAWCCHHESRGCPGTWHGSYHLHTHVEHGVGHAHGHIYDCEAGYSNWMQGWSDSKKDWCCNHEKKGCVKYHCTGHASWRQSLAAAWMLRLLSCAAECFLCYPRSASGATTKRTGLLVPSYLKFTCFFCPSPGVSSFLLVCCKMLIPQNGLEQRRAQGSSIL